MKPAEAGLPVPPNLSRGLHASREEWLASGKVAVEVLCQTIGREDLAGIELLDVGCGTKIVKTLLDNDLPIGHYAGIDVDPDVISWLQANVTDPRFEFHRIDAHNELYNPDGTPLADFDLLPVGPRRFDLISLFSVFTHLAPHDYVAMLHLLRRHIKPDGKLTFSLFLIDIEHPHPQAFADTIRNQVNSDDPAVREKAMAKLVEVRKQFAARNHDPQAKDQDPRFLDADLDMPLAQARYRRDYATELFDDTGWAIESIHPPHPEGHIQHRIVARPV
jgi:SAM-dependent methyltransferase